MPPSAKPVSRRLERLREQWTDFAAQPDGRVLCWRLQPDEYAMVNAFVAVEDDAKAGQTLDLFVPLAAPFVAGRYGDALLKEFLEKAEALHAGLEDAKAPAWAPPAPPPKAVEPLAFFSACESFVAHYQLPGALALVLTPKDIDDEAAFIAWLNAAARTALAKSTKVKLVVLDDARSPALAELTEALPKQVDRKSVV